MSWKRPFGGTKVHFCEIRTNRFHHKIYGNSLCGQNPFRKGTDKKMYVTCKKCIKILENLKEKEKINVKV